MGESDEAPFKDAEAFLRELGVERQPIEVSLDPEPPGTPTRPDPGAPGPAGTSTGTEAGPASDAVPTPPSPGEDTRGVTVAPTDADTGTARATDTTPTVSAREALRLSTQAQRDAAQREGDEAALPDPTAPSLEQDVSAAVTFIRNSTASAPQSEGRLRTKMSERGWSEVVVEHALERARRERLVDDTALAVALVEERRQRGHAVARLRRDLRERGFDAATIDAALSDAENEDPEAAAFAIAAARAARLTALPTETAYRRIVGFVVRRGYPDGLARKVAREAVYASRDPERTAGH